MSHLHAIVPILQHIVNLCLTPEDFPISCNSSIVIPTYYILEKYVEIGGSTLRLIRSYFCDRTQRVQINGIMSDFASLLCCVPHGSVLGPMKLYLYLLPLGAILRHHNIG